MLFVLLSQEQGLNSMTWTPLNNPNLCAVRIFILKIEHVMNSLFQKLAALEINIGA